MEYNGIIESFRRFLPVSPEDPGSQPSGREYPFIIFSLFKRDFRERL